MATLVSLGDGAALDGGSPINFLQITGNGIFADCALINSLSLKFDENPKTTAKDLALIARSKGAHTIKFSKEEITIL